MNDEEKKQMKPLARELSRICIEYFKDPEHQKEFEEWYIKKYGKEYIPTVNHRK